MLSLYIEASEGVPSQRVSARQKLSRLNALQFHELAMDVYDEMVRRIAEDKHGNKYIVDLFTLQRRLKSGTSAFPSGS